MAANLRSLLAKGEFIVAPGVFEMLSAKIADGLGFKALYMTGYGISASHLGLADAGLVTYRDMVERARTIAQGTRTPLIADADTGFGGLLNVRETVRGYEAAGVQAIQIEDQEIPKKCGHTPNRRVVPLEDAVKRVEVAVEARRSRISSSSRAPTRAPAWGWTQPFVARRPSPKPAPTSCSSRRRNRSKFKRVGGELAGSAKLLANMVPTGKSPVVSAQKLQGYGFSIAIYPSAGMGPACSALRSSYEYLLRNGSTEGSPVPAYDMKQLHELVGFPDVWEFERKHVETK